MKKTKSVHYNIKTLHEIVTVNDDIADIYTITEPQPLQKFIALLKKIRGEKFEFVFPERWIIFWHTVTIQIYTLEYIFVL